MRMRAFGVLWVVLSTPNALSQENPVSKFHGGNYEVTMKGASAETSYHGCHKNGNCLFIPRASHYQRGVYTWENKGFSYVLSPADEVSPDYMLRVHNPKGKVILNQRLKPTH